MSPLFSQPLVHRLKPLACTFASLLVVPTVQAEFEFELEEVVVTAQKISQSIQDTPIAVTAINSRTIREVGIANISDALISTPGATFTNYSKTQQAYSIRGISSGGEGAASDSANLTLVDGVVISRSFAHSANLFDVDRIEVLRGPQGTLYGKNAVGGLVHIITKRPTEEFEGYFDASLGDYSQYSFEGGVGGRLSETLLGRFSVHADARDGYTKDTSTGSDIDSVENQSFRAQLEYIPSDDLSILLRADYSKDNDGGVPRKPVNPLLPYDSPFTAYTDGSDDPWLVDNSDRPFYLDREIKGLSSELVWNFDGLTLTSITAYRKSENEAIVDNFGSPDALVWSYEANSGTQWSEELRLDNANDFDRLRWQLGLYFMHENIDRLDGRNLFSDHPFLPTEQSSKQAVTTDTWGVFGQGTYNLTDSTELTVGLRYSSDKKDFKVRSIAEGALADFFLDESPVSADTSESWSAMTGVVTLDHRLTEDMSLYGTISQGYKAGGFNGEAVSEESALIPYDEENVLNYEFGWKSELLDRRLRVNAALFSMQYDDIQVETFAPGSATVFIDNAGKASIDGFELEASALLGQGFSLSGSYALLDAKYDDFVSGDDDFSGNRVANTPEWTATLAAVYEHLLNDGSSIRIRLDYRGRSDVSDSPRENDLDQRRSAVDIFGARVQWNSSDEDWEVAAWGRNLSEEEELLQISPAGFMSQPVGVRGAPRTFGLSVKHDF